MTHTHTTTVAATTRRWDGPVVLGGAAFALATGLGAIAVFGADRQQDQIDAFPALVVFFGVLTALVFALVVRPAVTKGTSSRRVAVLGALALAGNAMFWAGLPAILGMATLAVRPHAPAARGTTVGVTLACVALIANVVLALVG
jgi:hypothetical protein